MKHLLILISILLLSSFLVSCEKKIGQGTRTYPNGEKYVGEFKNGIQNGQGTLTFPNGKKFKGKWKDGKPWNGTEYDKNGNIIVKWVNGEQIEQ